MPEEEIPVNAEEEKLNTAEECSQDDATIQTGEEETGGQETKKSKKEKPAVDDILKNFDAHPIEAPKKKKFGWIGTVFLLVVIGLGIYLMFNIVNDVGDVKSFGEVIAGSDWRWFLCAIAVLLVVLFCGSMKYFIILRTTTGKFYLRTSLKVAFLGKFYDNVTPFAVGGQPMQIYYLHKKGFSGGVSSAVILTQYFVGMFVWTLISLVLMASNTSVLSNLGDAAWEHTIMIGAWIGLATNMALPVMVAVFAIFPKVAKVLTTFAVNVGAKIKIVKDKEKSMKKAEKTVNDFRSSIKIMARNPVGFITLIVCIFIETFGTYALPFFVLKTFNALPAGSGADMMIAVMALNVYAAQSVAIIPSPGNSGAMEVVVAKAFSAVASTAVLSWAVLTWRFAVYYIYIIIGICLTVYEFIRKIYREQKAKKAAALAEAKGGGEPVPPTENSSCEFEDKEDEEHKE